MEQKVDCKCGRTWLIVWPERRDLHVKSRLMMKLRAAEKACGEAVADRQRFFEANERLQIRVAELQIDLEAAGAQRDLAFEQHRRMCVEKADLKAEVERARRERDGWMRTSKNWETAAGGAGEKIAELQRRIDELEQDNEGLVQAEHAAERAREDLLQMKTERDNLKAVQRHLTEHHSFGKCIPKADVEAMQQRIDHAMQALRPDDPFCC